MPRTVPSVALQNPGNIVTSAIWNSGPKAMGDFYTAPPIGRFRNTSAISTNSGFYYAMPMNVTDTDSDSGHSNVTNNSRYTAQVAGWYLVSGYAAWNNVGGTFDVYAGVAVNGTIAFGSLQFLIKSPDYSGISTEVMVGLKVGDYVEIYGRQDSGGALNTAVFSDLAPSMNVWWIHN